MTSLKNILFENIHFKQTVLKNTFWLSFAEVVTGVLRFALLIYVARILGANEYGKFVFAFSFVSFMVAFSDIGVIDIATRELSRNKENEKEFSSFLALDVVLSAGALVLMIIGSFLITSSLIIRKTIWVLSVFILITSFFQIFYSFIRSRQKMEYEAGVKIAQAVIFILVCFSAVFYFRSALGLGYGYLFSNLIAFAGLLIFFNFYFQPVRLVWNKNMFKLLKISWPQSLGFVNSWNYITVTSIMLGYFNLTTENGWYGAASKIALIAVIPANMIARSFYPPLSNLFVLSKEKLQKSWNYFMEAMIFLTIPMVVGGITLAPKIIQFFYGPAFAQSILLFQILVLIIGISFIAYPYSIMLVVSDHQKKNFALIAGGIITNALLNFFLIPVFGILGAVAAMMISSVFFFALTIFVSKYYTDIKAFNPKLFKSLFVSVISGLAMFLIIIQPLIYKFNIIWVVFLGFIVYFLFCIFMSSDFRNAIFAITRNIFKNQRWTSH